jgi:AcrR family transcriptional regulator
MSKTDPHSSEPRRRRSPEERPRQIIQAALEVFEERGLSGARLEDIARRAGIAKGTIYLYFPNKEELFSEVIRQTVIARLDIAQLQIDSPTGTVTEQVRAYTASWWEFLCTPEFQTVHRLVHGELHRFPELVRFYVSNVVSRSHALIGRLLQRGVDSGEFRALDVPSVSRIVSSLLITNAVWACKMAAFRPEALTPRDQVFEQVNDFLLAAVRAQTPQPVDAGTSSAAVPPHHFTSL